MRKVIYVKYSNERAADFSITTKMLEEDGVKYICKTPSYSKGAVHVEQIFDHYAHLSREYSASKIAINRCEKMRGGVRLDFVKGHTLAEEWDKNILACDGEALTEQILAYAAEIQNATKKIPFHRTEAFTNIFGKAELSDGLECMEYTNIDMVSDNVLVDDAGNWTLIDYEWTFDFPVPIHYVLYRMVYYYVAKGRRPQWVITLKESILEQLGITPAEVKQYEAMELCFQRYLMQAHVPIRDMYDAIAPQSICWEKLKETVEQQQAELTYDRELIHQMENTKVWKMYRKIKKK